MERNRRGRDPVVGAGRDSCPERSGGACPERSRRAPMTSICIVVQSMYDFDPRVRRKAEALVAAGYHVDVLALRSPDGQKRYTLNGVNVQTISLGKKRGSLARY